MAKKFLVDLDLNQCELQNPVIQNLGTDPANGIAGQIYYNTVINKCKFFDGTNWVALDPTSGVGAMTFKGTIGTGGTAGSALPTTGVLVGDTYKIVTAGTYDGQVCKIGDLFIATATTPTWAYVPSGDDTDVTSITAGVGLNTTSADTSTDGGTITSTGTLYLTKTAVTPGTYQGITVDKYGRVTGASNQGYSTINKYSVDITGDGATTSFTVTHNLSSRDVIVQVYDGSTYEEVIVDVTRASTSTVTIGLATAPVNAKVYRVVCIG
jgi:hypothetical protein